MTFKILSLDGGGIRGVLSAKILEEIEATLRKKGKKLHKYFDLIAGTSTGSILAAGIACKMNAQELINVYQEEGENIFLKGVRRQRNWLVLRLTQLLGGQALYPHERGEQGLAQVLKRKLIDKESEKPLTIADIKETQLLILAYDVLSRNTTWFANNDPTEWYYKNKIELWKICTASASAPTFFPPYELPYNSEESFPHIDGGVSANNPTLAAVAHALLMKRRDQKKTKIDEIAVLSIGTGGTTRPYTYREVRKWGALGWVKNLPHIFLDPSAENSEEISHRIFKSIDSQNYLRLDFDLNEQFHPKEAGKVRKKLDKPYNKYIAMAKKNGYSPGKEINEEIKEEIDNPDLCEDLIEAAKCYLNFGDVYYGDRYVQVKEAIQQFIDRCDQCDNKEKKEKKEKLDN